MKSVIKSLRPEVCMRIANGEQSIITAKSAPKEVPFKVYMYQTKHKCGCKIINEVLDGVYNSGKVIGEFICDKIDRYPYGDMAFPIPAYDGDPTCCECGNGYFITCGELEKTCLAYEDLENYGNGKRLYGWHISDLKIYDKPKELCEFWTVKCTNKKGRCDECIIKPQCIRQFTRPPRSWQYIEYRGGK